MKPPYAGRPARPARLAPQVANQGLEPGSQVVPISPLKGIRTHDRDVESLPTTDTRAPGVY
jgi:hypothetical protein